MNNRVDMFGMYYGNYILFFISAVCGSLAFILLIKMFADKNRLLAYIGRNSFFYLAFHQINLLIVLIACERFGWLQDPSNKMLLMCLDVILAVMLVGFLHEGFYKVQKIITAK